MYQLLKFDQRFLMVLHTIILLLLLNNWILVNTQQQLLHTVILAMMTALLLLILFKPGKLKDYERFRIVGKMVLWLPGLLNLF